MKLAEFKLAVDRAYEMLGSDTAVYMSWGGEVIRCEGVLVNVEYAEDGGESATVEVLG